MSEYFLLVAYVIVAKLETPSVMTHTLRLFPLVPGNLAPQLPLEASPAAKLSE